MLAHNEGMLPCSKVIEEALQRIRRMRKSVDCKHYVDRFLFPFPFLSHSLSSPIALYASGEDLALKAAHKVASVFVLLAEIAYWGQLPAFSTPSPLCCPPNSLSPTLAAVRSPFFLFSGSPFSFSRTSATPAAHPRPPKSHGDTVRPLHPRARHQPNHRPPSLHGPGGHFRERPQLCLQGRLPWAHR